MDFWDVTKLLFRRWYIATPLLVLTAAVAVTVGIVQKPDYQLTGYMQLVPAAAAAPGPTVSLQPVNPWNQIGLDSLSEAAQFGTLDQTFLDSLKAQGLTSNFTINIGQPPSGDTFEIVGSGRSQVQETARLVMDRFAGYVESLQTSYGVPGPQLITTKRLDVGTNISRPNGKVKRAVIAVVGAGAILSCAGAMFADYMSRRRRRPATGGPVAAHGGGYPLDGPVPPPRRPLSDLVTASTGSASVTGLRPEQYRNGSSPADETSRMSRSEIAEGPTEDPR